jgi:alanyl-tRNA synthetase
VKDIGKNFGLVLVDLENGNPKDFRKLSDKFVDQNKKDVLLLATVAKGKINYLLRAHKDNKEVDCSKVIRSAQEIVEGKGGGRPDMAQGSGEAANKTAFFQKVEESLQEL